MKHVFSQSLYPQACSTVPDIQISFTNIYWKNEWWNEKKYDIIGDLEFELVLHIMLHMWKLKVLKIHI